MEMRRASGPSNRGGGAVARARWQSGANACKGSRGERLTNPENLVPWGMAKVRKSVAFWVEGKATRYAIYIDKPKASRKAVPEDGAKPPWTVVICLDADDQFTELCKARAELAKTTSLPPLLLVGVGYGAGYASEKNKRMRDYTPGPDPEAEGREAGEAEAFLEFLETALWPELACRYSVDTRARGIAGHSLGGLLVLHALFRAKPFFNRALASAPSIWWGERAVLDNVARCQAKRGALSARLFVGIGLKDGKSMLGDVGRLEQQLAARPVRGLRTKFARFPGLTHYTAISEGFRTGLAALFGE